MSKLDTLVLASISQSAAGHFVSIYSHSAKVWVRLANRYDSYETAERAVRIYGWRLATTSVMQDGKRPTAKPGDMSRRTPPRNMRPK